MGLFDSVYVPCPKCKAAVEFQSKGAEAPGLDSYDIKTAPDDVLLGAIDKPHRCLCGHWFMLRDTNESRPDIVVQSLRPPPKVANNGDYYWGLDLDGHYWTPNRDDWQED